MPGSEECTLPEWEKAKVLNAWLLKTGKVTRDDIVLADGFWSLGLEEVHRVISVCHGNWSHTTADDVRAGIASEFPFHHAAQVEQRRRHLVLGKKLVAVSDFIADQMMLQWNFPSHVIDNGIDLRVFRPWDQRETFFDDPMILHMTTTANKGFDHIQAVYDEFHPKGFNVLSLDAAWERYHERFDNKYRLLASADLVVHPSRHEGNSYGVLETLASGVPIVSYNVGLMYRAAIEHAPVGVVMDSRHRRPPVTVQGVRDMWEGRFGESDPRGWVSRFSIDEFHRKWREYLGEEFEYASPQG